MPVPQGFHGNHTRAADVCDGELERFGLALVVISDDATDHEPPADEA